MLNREEIIRALSQLDPAAFEDVINAAFQDRHDPADAASRTRPDFQSGPETFARWLARRHMSSDAAIERVVYLPSGAPNDEIRLLEINRFLHPPDVDVIEPLDFTPDIDGLPFKVLVADVTMDQWERIQRGSGTTLPAGWSLEGYQVYSR